MKKIAADRNYKFASDGYEKRVRELAHDLSTLVADNKGEPFNAEINKAIQILDQPIPRKIQGGPQAIELPDIDGIMPRDLMIYLQNNRDSSLSHRKKLLRWRLPKGLVNEDMVDRDTAERLIMSPQWAKQIAEAFKKDYPTKTYQGGDTYRTLQNPTRQPRTRR